MYCFAPELSLGIAGIFLTFTLKNLSTMINDIQFNDKVAYQGKKWGTAKGISIMQTDTINVPSPNEVKVINLNPVNKNGTAACCLEIPVSQLEDVILAMRKAANPDYDEVQAAKNLLIANGYVSFFVSSEEIEMVATEMQRELNAEELESIIAILSNNDLEIGICEEAVRGAISEICPDATDGEWEEDGLGDNMDDDSDLKHVESLNPDFQ